MVLWCKDTIIFEYRDTEAQRFMIKKIKNSVSLCLCVAFLYNFAADF